jgi:hypothetical protein
MLVLVKEGENEGEEDVADMTPAEKKEAAKRAALRLVDLVFV